MHEYIRRQTDEFQGSSDRIFGLVFAAVFLIIAAYPLWGGGAIRSWALGLAGGFGIVALLMPTLLRPANRLWIKFGLLLHAIVSPVALGILFFVVVFPTGLLVRLLGKDLLHLRFEPAASSYWMRRDPPGPAPESLNRQF